MSEVRDPEIKLFGQTIGLTQERGLWNRKSSSYSTSTASNEDKVKRFWVFLSVTKSIFESALTILFTNIWWFNEKCNLDDFLFWYLVIFVFMKNSVSLDSIFRCAEVYQKQYSRPAYRVRFYWGCYCYSQSFLIS